MTLSDFGYRDVDAPKYFKIFWLSNLLAFTVPDEGYFRNALCALSLISMFLFNSDDQQILKTNHHLSLQHKKDNDNMTLVIHVLS